MAFNELAFFRAAQEGNLDSVRAQLDLLTEPDNINVKFETSLVEDTGVMALGGLFYVKKAAGAVMGSMAGIGSAGALAGGGVAAGEVAAGAAVAAPPAAPAILVGAGVFAGLGLVSWFVGDTALNSWRVWRDNWNALHFAAAGGHAEVAAELIRRGINVSHKDKADRTADDVARAFGHADFTVRLRSILQEDVVGAVQAEANAIAREHEALLFLQVMQPAPGAVAVAAP